MMEIRIACCRARRAVLVPATLDSIIPGLLIALESTLAAFVSSAGMGAGRFSLLVGLVLGCPLFL
jgi:hypothetical protein